MAISEPGRDYTYAEFEDRAARLAAALAAAGVGPGDKVACYLYNGAAYLETVFAAFKLGAVPVNANYRYTQARADRAAGRRRRGGRWCSAASSRRTWRTPRARSRRCACSSGWGSAAAGAGPDAHRSSRTCTPRTAPRPAAPRPGADQLFMYTGGTTGKPKGVIWQLSDLLHSMQVSVFQRLGVDHGARHARRGGRDRPGRQGRGRSPVMMPAVPLMHATGLFNCMGALLVGGRVVTARPGRLDPRHVWETVAAQRVRTLVVAGNAVCQPLVDELLAAERDGRPHDLSSLGSVISSGTVLSDRLKRALHERAAVTITDALASSEGGPFAFAITSSAADLPSRFFPAAATRVLTADGAEVAPGSGQVGTLAFGGPIPEGYYKDAAKTTATFRTVGGTRYSMPGDLVTVDADGADPVPRPRRRGDQHRRRRRCTRRRSRTCCSPTPA